MIEKIHYTFVEDIFNRIEGRYTVEEFFCGLLKFGPRHTISPTRDKLASSVASLFLFFSNREDCLDAALQVVENAAASSQELVRAKVEEHLPSVLQQVSDACWIQDWSLRQVKERLKKEVLHLVEPKSGLYGNAANVKAEQILNFSMDSMIGQLKDHAPTSWEIIRSLVDATDSKRRLKNKRGRENKRERERE
jgi:hypothetical protein